MSGALKRLSRWSAGLSNDVVWFYVQVLVIGLLGPLTLALSHGGERGQSVGCRSIAASLFGFARAITGYSFLIQNTASPMSPDHRSSGRFLVGVPPGISQLLSLIDAVASAARRSGQTSAG